LIGPRFAIRVEPVTPDMIREVHVPDEPEPRSAADAAAEEIATLQSELRWSENRRLHLEKTLQKFAAARLELRRLLQNAKSREATAQRQAEERTTLKRQLRELQSLATRAESRHRFTDRAHRPAPTWSVNDQPVSRELYEQQHQVMLGLTAERDTARRALAELKTERDTALSDLAKLKAQEYARERAAKGYEQQTARYLVDTLTVLVDAGLVEAPGVWTLEATGAAIRKGLTAAIAMCLKARTA
jgi:hypothetical protein